MRRVRHRSAYREALWTLSMISMFAIGEPAVAAHVHVRVVCERLQIHYTHRQRPAAHRRPRHASGVGVPMSAPVGEMCQVGAGSGASISACSAFPLLAEGRRTEGCGRRVAPRGGGEAR